MIDFYSIVWEPRSFGFSGIDHAFGILY